MRCDAFVVVVVFDAVVAVVVGVSFGFIHFGSVRFTLVWFGICINLYTYKKYCNL